MLVIELYRFQNAKRNTKTSQMCASTHESNQMFRNEILHVLGKTRDAAVRSDKLADAKFSWYYDGYQDVFG